MTTYYADAASPGGNGLTEATAFSSLAAFLNVTQPGDILIPSGRFRETFDPPADCFIYGNPANPFIVSGGEVLPGLIPCVAGDAAKVGAIWNECRKTRLPKTTFISADPLTANLSLDGVQMNLATSRSDTTDGFFYLRPSTYWTATEVPLSGTSIVGFKLTALTDPLTKAQIDQTRVAFVHGANVGGLSVANFNVTTDVIEISGAFTYDDGNPASDSFALQNLAAAMLPGQWSYWDEGDGTVTVFVRALTGAIEYSARDIGINLDDKSNIEIEGFQVEMVSGLRRGSAPIYARNVSPHQSNIVLRDFKVCESYCGGDVYGAIYIQGVDDLVIENAEIVRTQAGFSMFLQGNNAGAADDGFPENVRGMQRVLVRNVRSLYSSRSPFRFFTQHNGVFNNLFAANVALAAHGNDLILYQGGYNCVFWGINLQNECGGYMTFQESDSLVYAFCAGSASKAANGGNRWFESQQNTVPKQGDVYGYLPSAVLNCRGVPNPERWDNPQYQNGARVTKNIVPLDRFHFRNNISCGWSAESFNPLPLSWSHNSDTSPSGTASTLYGTGDIRTRSEYVDPATGDFRYVQDALNRSLTASDWSDLIPGFMARWPHAPAEMWTQDLARGTIPWNQMRRGPTPSNMDADLTDGDVVVIPDAPAIIQQGAATIVVDAP